MKDLTVESYVEYLLDRGHRIKKVTTPLSPDLEIPNVIIGEESQEPENILLFNSIRGFNGFKGISLLLNTRRKLIELLNVKNDVELYKKILSSIEAPSNNIREVSTHDYRVVSDFDLNRLPFARFYDGEQRPYLTSGIVIGVDLETGSVNASIHRLTPVDRNKLVIRLVPRHLYSIWAKNREKGRDTPVAIVWGINPVALLAAACSPPFGVFELALVEKLVNVPLRVFYDDCLPVPTDAEVVLVGKLLRDKFALEGPCADILMLYDDVREQPVVKVERVYMRVRGKELYAHYLVPGLGEHRILMSIEKEAKIWKFVSNVVPEVRAVRLTPGGGSWLHAVISIRKNTDGDAKNAILAAFSAHPSLKHVVVVDQDINVDDPSQVEWAIATRFRADKDLVVIHNVRGSTLDPSCIDQNTGLTCKVGIDATRPVGDSKKFERVTNSLSLKYEFCYVDRDEGVPSS
ncbi:MAG: UbiD family decarboxylase [Crenarchaeota archaeon]|nr:UbiD family decarboxylase [Thermoproteota archaeon]